MKFTSTIHAYLTDRSWSQARFLSAAKSGDDKAVIEALTFSNVGMESEGWVKVGKATVVVDVIEEDAIRLGFIDALKEKKAKVLAEAQHEATKIEEQIQNLLAIAYEAQS